MPGAELGLWICDPPENCLSEVRGNAFLGALEVVDAEFKCRD